MRLSTRNRHHYYLLIRRQSSVVRCLWLKIDLRYPIQSDTIDDVVLRSACVVGWARCWAAGAKAMKVKIDFDSIIMNSRRLRVEFRFNFFIFFIFILWPFGNLIAYFRTIIITNDLWESRNPIYESTAVRTKPNWGTHSTEEIKTLWCRFVSIFAWRLFSYMVTWLHA